MNNIINGLFWNHEFKNMYGYILEKAGYKESDDFKRLAIELFNLNYDAVNYRYDEKNERDKVNSFVWVDKSGINKFQVLKSMRCLHYQCSEGDITKSKLYKLLSKLIEVWTDFLINSIKEYDKAEWG